MAPWTLYLAVTLPRHYSAHHYWLGWAGFDVALVVVLVITGLSIRRGSPAVTRYAAVAATMLVIDAWFDVINAATGSAALVAVSLAVVVELPADVRQRQLDDDGQRHRNQRGRASSGIDDVE